MSWISSQPFAAVARQHPDASLDLAGDNRSFPREDVGGAIAAASRLGGRIRWHRYVSDAQLADLYGRARAFAFLSEYEGLGLTPLEALAAGVPPVLFDTPVARESCGAAALYVQQGRSNAIVARDRTAAVRRADSRAAAGGRARCAGAIQLAGRRDARRSPRSRVGTDVTMAVDVSIVIVSFNARADLERCLQSLHDAPPARSHEVIVVDNASSDGSADAARRWPRVSG